MHRVPTSLGPSGGHSSSRQPGPVGQQQQARPPCCALHTRLHAAHQHASRPVLHAVSTAAVGRRQSEQQPSEGPTRQRRTRRTGNTSENTSSDFMYNSSSSSSGGGGGRPPQASWQRSRRSAPQQRRQGSGPAAAGDDDDEFDYEDPLDSEFLDPDKAAKLRKLMKAQGRDAVLDKRGYVKLPALEDGAAAAANTGPSRRRERRSSSSSINNASSTSSSSWQQRPSSSVSAGSSAGLEVADEPAAAAGPTPSSSRDPAHSRLFSTSQLQAAAPGSGGTQPVLPIVRPGSSPAAASSSSPQRLTAEAATKSRAGSASASDFYSSSSWRDLGALRAVQDAVTSIGLSRPSHIQAEAYKALNRKAGLRHVAVADQAGSGKTLAYLLPLLQQLKEREQELGGPATTPNSPSIIILTPTTELAQQVGRVVRALSQAGLRVRSAIMTGGQTEADRRSKTFRTQCELLSGGVDVLVATPGRLLSHHDRGSLRLTNTAALVLDEVDVLAGGEVDYNQHIAPLRAAAPASMRCVLVSATLPQHTFDELQELFVGLGAAFGPGLHRTAAGVVEELIDCSGGDEISLETGTARKLEALMTSLDRVRSPRTVVFCNKIETCRVVENALRRQKPSHQVLVYHEAVREGLRTAALNTWLSPPSASEPPMVLVCTDRTSRGIDSMWCEHVVLFEFPRDPSEYVRRVGRTARGAGGKGVVSALVLGKQVPLAKDILDRNRDGVPVHRVPRLWSDK